jgi:transcription initiation factor IIE alpha subunit
MVNEMATFCPYCDEEIEDAINKDWVGDYWTFSDDFECPKCGKDLEIDVEQEPVFIARKKAGKQAR